MRRITILAFTAIAFLMTSQLSNANERDNELVFNVKKLAAPPVIDGVLEGGEWDGAEIQTGDWKHFHPSFRPDFPQRTVAYATYDDEALYFAIRSFDTEPNKVKTYISKRDEMYGGDWVGVLLDALNTKESCYALYSNPSGIQGDSMRFSNDTADDVDWVWDSAGKVNSEGYFVEMRIPLKTIRYKGGKETRMGVCFRRGINRLGVSANWPDQPPGKGPLMVMATLVYRGLPEPRTFELLPSVTYSNNSERKTSGAWGESESIGSFGVNVKYGLSTSLILDATFNPDFSQVESDEFQVEVNQRYPVFYNEKRPFFTEGVSIFKLPLSGMYNLPSQTNLTAHVHTRRIIDPRWGVKLSGTVGKFSFGSLTASDEATGRILGGEEDTHVRGKSKLFSIGRIRYNLDGDNYFGGIVLDTELGGGYNRIAGMDGSFRFGNHRFQGYLLQSASRDPLSLDDHAGLAAVTGYTFENRNVKLMTVGEHFEGGFRMDTAFYRRTGISMGHLMAELKLYPDKSKYPWITIIRPSLEVSGGRDRLQGGSEFFATGKLEMQFIKRGHLFAYYRFGREPWAGQRFNSNCLTISSGLQPFRQLFLQGWLAWSDSIYYDAVNPFAGRTREHAVNMTLQPTSRLQETIAYRHVTFDKASSGERIYTVHILNTRTVYQFSEKFFLRAVIQYDSSIRQILTDFLASYTLVPGTVVYAGYGSLIEKRRWEDDRWRYGVGGYLTTRRSFFFKASYLWRF